MSEIVFPILILSVLILSTSAKQYNKDLFDQNRNHQILLHELTGDRGKVFQRQRSSKGDNRNNQQLHSYYSYYRLLQEIDDNEETSTTTDGDGKKKLLKAFQEIVSTLELQISSFIRFT